MPKGCQNEAEIDTNIHATNQCWNEYRTRLRNLWEIMSFRWVRSYKSIILSSKNKVSLGLCANRTFIKKHQQWYPKQCQNQWTQNASKISTNGTRKRRLRRVSNPPCFHLCFLYFWEGVGIHSGPTWAQPRLHPGFEKLGVSYVGSVARYLWYD